MSTGALTEIPAVAASAASAPAGKHNLPTVRADANFTYHQGFLAAGDDVIPAGQYTYEQVGDRG